MGLSLKIGIVSSLVYMDRDQHNSFLLNLLIKMSLYYVKLKSLGGFFRILQDMALTLYSLLGTRSSGKSHKIYAKGSVRKQHL